MWAILEGPDGSGKSTLAQAVAELSGARLVNLGPPDSAEVALDAVIAGPFATYAPGAGVDLVSDRHHWGDPVYGPIKRPWNDVDGYGDLGRAGWRYAELFAESRGACTYLVDVDSELAKERIAERGDDYVDKTDVDDIIERYNWLADDAVTLHKRVRLSEAADTQAAALSVVEAAREKERTHAPLGRFKHYVGGLNPEMLVVMPPDRDKRLEVVASLSDDGWRRVGLASTAMTEPILEDLYEVLDKPSILGYGHVPQHLETVIAKYGGSFTREVESVRKFMRT